MNVVRVRRRALTATISVLSLGLLALAFISFGDSEPTRPIGVASFKRKPAHVVRDLHKRLVEEAARQADESPFNIDVQTVDLSKQENEDRLRQGDERTSPSDEMAKRRAFVREMMKHAWDGYRNFSWGANELSPISKRPHAAGIFGGDRMPATIVDAADTLFIMGMDEEYEQAKQYMRANYSLEAATGTLSLFETTIRFVGGFLSLYALTKDEFYKQHALATAEVLLPAFNTGAGIPKSNVNVKAKIASNYGWALGGQSILAEIGSLHLEFLYLASITGRSDLLQKVQRVRDVLDAAKKPDGLYPNYISPDSGLWSAGGRHVSLGALGDSFYEYLIKSWLIVAKDDEQARRMYFNVSEAIKQRMVFKSPGGLTYVAELRGSSVEHKMGHLACFAVGMFALEAKEQTDPAQRTKALQLAEELAHTCHEGYIRAESRIGPEMMVFRADNEAKADSEHGYILRPEVIEGFFYMWRVTGNTKYRDWVWDAIQAINQHCRVDAGFVGLANVYRPAQGHDDTQQSFFLAETLKYAYLTFCDNDVMSLDRWVFNTEAHPLPVLPQHPSRAFAHNNNNQNGSNSTV